MALEDTQTYLRRLLDFKESPLDSDLSLPTDALSPLRLLDRHIPDHLLLKRVTIVPSLASDIADVTDAHYDDILALPARQVAWSPRKPKSSDATSVADLRRYGLGFVCTSIATCLAINPNQPDNEALINWVTTKRLYTQDHDPFFVEQIVLRFDDVEDEHGMQMPLEDSTHQTMLNLRDHSRDQITALFFSACGRSLLEDMSELTASEFPWSLDSKCSKGHIPGVPGRRLPDVPIEDSVWKLPISQDTIRPSALRRSSRLMDQGEVAWTRIPVPGNITPLPHINRFEEGYEPMMRDYVQRAWANAVRLDSTVILFDCGTAMRIGIRHRATQTLFLTGLIDLVTSETPTFGKLFTGLHLAVARDALKRLPLVMGKKRPRDDDQHHRPISVGGPQKPTTRRSSRQFQQTQLHVRKSKAIATYFRYRGHDSPAPILLYSQPSQVQQPIYTPKEYIRLVLDKPLGAGATGEAITAFIEPDASSSNPKYTELRLAREHKVYMHLEAANVTGIPRSLGFWEDTRGNISALILAYAGRPLGELQDENRKVTLTPAQSASLAQTLECIHKAGVLHRDLRSWNMLVDRFDRVFITDFDQSSFNGSEEDYRLETERLQKFTAGAFIDNDTRIRWDDDWVEDDRSHSTENTKSSKTTSSSRSE
ncbi:hypothetical protein BDZ89DRAFT_1086524 [Hymenopellis radicata]|nr:hypothetical protein BDZ89DRAFT_1086524 [Hymenopellis radicata]